MKLLTSYICQQCGHETQKWYGKCPECGTWNSMVETVKEKEVHSSQFTVHRKDSVKPVRLSDVKHIEKDRVKSEFEEFDRVMGGGIVPGSVTLLSGDPGIGKSTLLLHVVSRTGGLYISGEESAEQVKLRAKRLGIEGKNIMILPETDVERITDNIRRMINEPAGNAGASVPGGIGKGIKGDYGPARMTNKKDLNSPFTIPGSGIIIIDSIQTLSSSELSGMPGSVGQVRYCAEVLTKLAKSYNVSLLIIGHVTKEGSIAGPKVLEHMVDTVLYMEGEKFAAARILRTLKNRFGAIEEVGIFEMSDAGLKEIDNPSAIFLKDRVKNVSGSVITVVMEGTRPLLVEIQALVVPTQLAIPRRIANGFEPNRLQLIGAILTKRLNLPLGSFDIFVNVSGGLKINEPAADLAVALAIISSFKNKPLDSKALVFGELGLLGEVRSVNAVDRRIKEAKRLGFTRIVFSANTSSLKSAINIID